MITAIGLVIAGLVLLVVGGEMLVRGAVGLAEKAGAGALAACLQWRCSPPTRLISAC